MLLKHEPRGTNKYINCTKQKIYIQGECTQWIGIQGSSHAKTKFLSIGISAQCIQL